MEAVTSSEVTLEQPEAEKVDKASQSTPEPKRRCLHCYHCPQSDEVDATPSDDLTGSIFELEQEEISTPKGPRKERIPKAPNFPKNPDWLDPAVLLEELWNKKRTIRQADDKPEKFVFPTSDDVMDAPYWQIPKLMELKKELNAVKSSLDRLPLDPWHHHTKKMNIAHLITSYVKQYYNPEFSSQAWGKMFELLCSYSVIPEPLMDLLYEAKTDETEELEEEFEQVPFDSVHLCEAPGAFISALNHFIQISYSNMDWNWLATTLNPYHEANDVGKMINDDRLILMSLDHWTFLEDWTGNILSNRNLSRLVSDHNEKLTLPRKEKSGQEKSHVLLVTADGSIDCQMNPADQELTVAHLQFGEIVAALKLLQEGGSFILKIFTFLESVTISHLYLLSCLFKEVHLHKPATSKEGNSEVYVVCLQYLGLGAMHKVLAKFVSNLETYGKRVELGKLLLPRDAIPDFFIERIEEAAMFFCNYQMKIIKRNLSCFPCENRIYLLMKTYRKEAAEQYIEWTEIKVLPKKSRLFCSDVEHYKNNKCSHVDLREEYGCFADKQAKLTGTDVYKLECIQRYVTNAVSWKTPLSQVIFGAPVKIGPMGFEKPYKNIRSSRFCYGRLLAEREEVKRIGNKHKVELQKEGVHEMGNVCSFHTPKRIYESMGASCDVDPESLDVMCFAKSSWDFVAKADFEQQKQDLFKLFEFVQEMGIERSLFLCRYPMLTRLQTGIIHCIAGFFEKVIIYGDPSKGVVGIMLFKFKSLAQSELKNTLSSINDVFKVLRDEEFNWPILQIVPMKTLVETLPEVFVLQYNVLLVTQDMQRAIGVINNVITSSRETTPFTNDESVGTNGDL